MAIDIVNIVTGQSALTTTVSIDEPSTSSDQVLLAFLGGSFPGPTVPTFSSAPSGYSIVSVGEAVNGSSHLAAVYTKQGGTALGTISWVANYTATRLRVVIVVCSGANTSSIVDAVNKGTGSGGSHVAPSVTTTVADTRLFGWWSGEVDGFAPVSLFYEFTPPGTMTSEVSFTTIDQGAALLADQFVSATGATGTRTATLSQSFPQFLSAFYTVAIKPYLGPTVPVITAPTTGESITIGRTYTLSCNPSTDPNTAQSSLTYTWKYSLNNGLTKTTIGTGAAGVTTLSWNTSGLTATTQARIYCFASDGVNNSQEGVTGQFTLAADLAPGPPQSLTPNGGSLDRASNQTIAWAFNDPGDVQSERTWEWGTDGVTFGNVSTLATSSTSIAVTGGTGILASRGQKYHRVKVKDNAGTASSYSATSTFFAGDKPATPNITAPTAGSPPTTSNPTYTFTSSSSFTQRKVRITQGGAEVFNKTTVSTATSFTENYALANGLAYVLFISVLGIDGIWSNEDSETFTPSFTGPAQPTITLTTNTSEGTIQIAATNSDTPDRQEVWRFEDGQTANDAIRLTKTMVADGSFIDGHVKSGVTYHYWIRAYSGDLFTDSATDDTSVTLSKLHIDIATKTSSTGNRSGLLYVALDNQAPMDYSQGYVSSRDKTKGRTKPTTGYTQTKTRRLRALVRVKNSDYANVTKLRDIFAENGTGCIRDQKGNLFFFKLRTVQEQDFYHYVDIVIDEPEAYYIEHVG